MLSNLHLRLKSDRCPNGRKISAVNKVLYINRVGKYKDIDIRQMREHEIFRHAIFAERAIEPPLPNEQILYRSINGTDE